MPAMLDIEVYFDFVCPWCLIGKHHLGAALRMLAAEHPRISPRVRWSGVQLLPDIPPAGVPFVEFYEQRLGGAANVRARQAQVRAAAAAAGAEIAFERIRTMPNTRAAHRMFRAAVALGDAGRVDTLLDRTFAAYFNEGRDIGDRDTLLAIAESCGYSGSPMQHAVDAMAGPAPASAFDQSPAGVPAFVLDARVAVVGAQPPEVLRAAMRRTVDAGHGANPDP